MTGKLPTQKAASTFGFTQKWRQYYLDIAGEIR